MTPSTWASFFFFTYFLVPGLFLDILSKRYRRASPETPLREIGRVVLGSMAFSTIGLVFLCIVRLLRPSIIVDPGLWLQNPHGYFVTQYKLIIWTLIFEQIIALLAVALYNSIWVALNNPNFTEAQQWEVLFLNSEVVTGQNPEGLIPKSVHYILRHWEWLAKRVYGASGAKKKSYIKPVARVTLNSKEEIVGYVDMYSVEESVADREILLRVINPKDEGVAKLPQEFQEIMAKDTSWVRMSIPFHSIEKISVVYFEFPLG